jgi:PEP-CTERM motif-containing protein
VAQAVAVFFACIAFFAGAASASPIALVSEERRVSVSYAELGVPLFYVDHYPSSSFAPFSATAVLPDDPYFHPAVRADLQATQDTTITDSAFGGSLAAVAPGSPTGNHLIFATSYLSVTFDVDEPAAYAWSGTLTFQGEVVSSRASLLDVTTNTFVFLVPEALAVGSPIDFSRSGSLTPGHRYRFEQIAGGQVLLSTTGASTSWGFDFTVVPEPGTASLLGFGLTVLARASRRRG